MKAVSATPIIILFGIIVIALFASFGDNLNTVAGGSVRSTCTDTDSGQNIYVKGNCTKGTSYTDSCVSSSTLAEYYCSSNRCKSVQISCPSGYSCSNGACIAINATCTPNWSCTSFSACSATYNSVCSNSATGTQTRTCTDLNNCGTTSGKPAESQSCTQTRNTDGIACTTSTGSSGTCSGGVCTSSTNSTNST